MNGIVGGIAKGATEGIKKGVSSTPIVAPVSNTIEGIKKTVSSIKKFDKSKVNKKPSIEKKLAKYGFGE